MTLLLTDRKILLLTTPKKFTISLFKTFLDLVMLAVSFKIYNISKDILLNVKNGFTYYQRCKKKNCSFHASFYLFLDYYIDSSNCVLREMQKILYSFTSKKCKILTFFDCKIAANENCVIYLKEKQILVQARKKKKKENKQGKDEVGEKKKNQLIDSEN